MTDKHELDINEEVEATPEAEAEIPVDDVAEEAAEAVEELTEEVTEETADEEAEETTEENALEEVSEEDAAEVEKNIKEEFISEFAPEPIKIPKYDKAKEKRRAEKAKAKKKRLKSKKARRRRKRIRKALIISRNILFTVLMVAFVTTILMSIMVRLNTSEYSVEKAIRNSNPETYVIGKIKNTDNIEFEQSSPRASLVDILRDNSMIPITYAEIENYVDRSTYPVFVAGIAHDVINYFVYGTPMDNIDEQVVFDVLYENRGVIEIITSGSTGSGYFGDVMCDELADKVVKSKAIKAIDEKYLSAQPMAKMTRLTAMMFSTVVLILLVVLLIVLLVLTVIYCKGYWHLIIGGSVIGSGVLAGLAGYFFRVNLNTDILFIKSMVEAVVKGFNNSAIVFAAVSILVGILVLLLGKAFREDEELVEE